MQLLLLLTAYAYDSQHVFYPGDDDLSSLSEDGEKAKPAKTKV